MEADALAIQTELDKVLGSRCFRSCKVLGAFLRYTVTQTLAGNAANLNQYRIAVEGLEKPSDFNAAIDPLVRVQAGRLRKLLEEYYAGEGRSNALRISLPNGHYQPIFTPRTDPTALASLTPDIAPSSLSLGPGIVCIPRVFVTHEDVGWLYAARLTRDYSTALTRFSFCQVMFADGQANGNQDAWLQYGADFALFFDLHTENAGYSLKCSLVSSLSRQIIWAHSFSLGESYPEPAALKLIFRRIAHDTLAYDPGVAHSYWVRQLLDSGKPIASHHQVLVAVRQYIWNPTPVAFRTSLRACEQRLKQVPHDTQALFVYANHCFTEYAMKYQAIESIETKLADAADAMLELDPGNAYSHAYRALACLLAEEHEPCRAALEKAQASNPLDSYLNVHVGLIYLGLGEWQRGAQCIQDTIGISPTYPDWYNLPLSICHYREGRYLMAMQAAKQVRLKHLWTPMLRTALYQCNQRLEKGTQEFAKLVNDHPDFAQAGRKLAQGFPAKPSGVIQQLLAHLPGNHTP